MSLGLLIFTLVHTAISLVGIISGVVVACGMIDGKRLDGWTKVFLLTTIATSVTGFFFPFHGFKPSYVVGALSLIVLALAWTARYRHLLSGGWRVTYVISALIALYFNVFVLIVQSFLKIPALTALAPTQTEPPFKMAQLTALVLFIGIAIVSVKKFRVV